MLLTGVWAKPVHLQGIENIAIQSSVSLQHVPYNKDLEKSLPQEVLPRLSFAKQKVEEIVALAKAAKADKSKKLQLPAVGEPSSRVYDFCAQFIRPCSSMSFSMHEVASVRGSGFS